MTMQYICSAQGLTRTSRENQIVRIMSAFVKNGDNYRFLDRMSFSSSTERDYL